MAQQTINLGATGSGAGGDSARTAFEKSIANFAELYIAALPGTAAQKQTAREMFGAENASNLTSGTLPDARVSSTLTADKAFRRGNILGAVSQSAGVPTGAIIERGSNANGEYIRWADGTQICTARSASITSTTVGGSVFCSDTQTWQYPAPFVGTPIGAASSNTIMGWASCIGAASASMSWRRWTYASHPTSIACDLVAIGRWY